MVVVISGASAGIGRALALDYLARGHSVAAIARSAGKLAKLEASAPGHAELLRTFPADVRDKASMAAVADQVHRAFGPVDLVIANAGVAERRGTPGLDADAVAMVFATNVLGVVNTVEPYLKNMARRGTGQVAVISSLAAIHYLPGLGPYCASKAALGRLFEGLYWDLQADGIAVSTICPGFIATDMTRGHTIPARWLMSLDTAVERIVTAIEAKRRMCHFPFEVHAAIRLLALLPDRLKGLVLNKVFHRVFPQTAVEPS